MKNVGHPFLALRQNSLDLLATARVDHMYISTIVQKIEHLHAFVEFSVISVHREYSSGKKRTHEIRTFLFSSTSPGLSALHTSKR